MNLWMGQNEAVSAGVYALDVLLGQVFADLTVLTGSFPPLGATGVGKTELCKSLAKFPISLILSQAMVRVDMSDLWETLGARLIGRARRYLVTEEGGFFDWSCSETPDLTSVVYLPDEVEKAHQIRF